jgi:alcohol dehydrogenase class IV
MAYNLVSPRYVLIGGGAVGEIAATLGKLALERPLVVSDEKLAQGDLIKRCLDPLTKAGIKFDIFSDIVPEPTDTMVKAGAKKIRAGNYDCLIGFGGGTSMDVAKAMSILATSDKPMNAYKVPYAADAAKLPVIAIPTTGGTGSEVTRFTVITDTSRGEKMLIAGLGALPLAAIIDYELTYSVNPRTTADTGVDSLTHALESYISRRANVISDTHALHAMSLIGANIRSAYREPTNAKAREGMMLGSSVAGMSFTNSSVALVHGMSRPIGAHFHVPHGLSNAMLFPAVTRFSLASGTGRYAAAARAIGFADAKDNDDKAADKLAEGLAALNAELSVPGPKRYGIDPAQWEGKLELMAEQALASGSPANNPRVPDKAEIVALYRQVWAANA